MSGVIVTGPPKADPKDVEAIAAYGTATVHEAMGRTGLLGTRLRPVQQGVRVAGTAVTVLSWPGDNLMIHAAVEQCGEGDVLVVTTTSPSTDGMFGELLATSLRSRGVAGIVIDAGVRDVADLTAMDFPAWSRAIHSQGTVKATAGSVNIPVVCAGQLVCPGDIVIGDIDGVCVVPKQNDAEVVTSSQARLAKEAKAREKLRAGELGLDFYGLRAKLTELGVAWVDQDSE